MGKAPSSADADGCTSPKTLGQQESSHRKTVNGTDFIITSQAYLNIQRLPASHPHRWRAETTQHPRKIVVPENSDATHEDILKVAMLLFLNYVDAATAMSESYGGGGGTGTGWGKKDDEDELEWARRCAMKANWLCKPIVRKWKRGK